MKVHLSTSNFKLKNFLSFVTVILSIFAAIYVSSYFLSRPDSYRNRLGFYDADDCDVIFFGTSHMYNGIFPMELYKDYGISSWNLAYGGERLPLTYYNLKDAIKVHNPKVVVIDVYGFEYGDQKNDPDQPARSHNSLDAIKSPIIKYQAVTDCIEKKYWPEFFFPLYLYHDRWFVISEENNKKRATEREYTRGAFYLMGVADATFPQLISPDDYSFADNNATMYMQKIIDLCAQNDIKVLMINIPYPASYESQRRANMAYEIAKRNENVEFLNMIYMTDEIGINFDVDYADETSHLNPSGARKTTRFLGQYLKNNYELADYRNDEKWIELYDDYISNVKNKYFVNTCDIYQYLMLMSDSDYEILAYYKDASIWNNNDKICKLYNNIFEENNMTVLDKENLSEEYWKEDLYDKTEVVYQVIRRDTNEVVDISYWDVDGNRIVLKE